MEAEIGLSGGSLMLPQSVEHGHQRNALLSSFALHDLVSFT